MSLRVIDSELLTPHASSTSANVKANPKEHVKIISYTCLSVGFICVLPALLVLQGQVLMTSTHWENNPIADTLLT